MIVATFNASTKLCEAVRKEVEKYQRTGLDYFSPECISEVETLEAEIQDLQLKRCVCVFY